MRQNSLFRRQSTAVGDDGWKQTPTTTIKTIPTITTPTSGKSNSYPSLLAKSTQLSDSSPLSCKSSPCNHQNKQIMDSENQTVPSVANIKNNLQKNKNSSILTPQCTNKLPPPPSTHIPTKFIIPSQISAQQGKNSTMDTNKEKSNKNVNHFRPPLLKRSFDEFNSSQNSKTPLPSTLNTKPTKTKKQKKEKQVNMAETATFQKILFENCQKELSNETLISATNPLTPSPESNGNISVFNVNSNALKTENPVSYSNNTNFMVLSDSQDSIILPEEVIEIDNGLVEEAVSSIFNSKLGSSLSLKTKEKWLRNMINPVELSNLGSKNLFGEYYPSIGSITFKDKKPRFTLLSDGSFKNISEATGKSIYHSFSRLARLLMSLDLGKSMLFVNFSEDDWDQDDTLELVRNTCLNGLRHSSAEYKFFGTSNSGINGYTALFIDTRLNFSAIQDILGDFSECAKSGPRKVFSRIGLSLGKSYQSLVELKEEELYLLHDEQDFPGVDGAGFMHEDYFKEILQRTIVSPFFDNYKESNQTIMDCDINEIVAIQFRASGMKGVFQSIPDEYWKELQTKLGFSDKVRCVARPSLVKFKGNTEIYRNFDILNISRIQGGSISRTFMSCMLRRTSNREEMQKLFFNMLDEYTKAESNISDPKFLFNSLLSCDVFDSGDSVYKIVKNLILAGFGIENPFVYKYIKRRVKSRFQSLIDNKLCLKMKSKYSVTLMGVIDESGELDHDEVYIPCLKLQEQLSRDYYKLKEVIVYRHPLAYEGDIAKLKLRKDPCNSFLASRSNVIVFPKVFRKKSPHQYLAGGDLDGDSYEVVFDLNILKLFDKPSTPIDYDEGKQSSTIAQASQPVTKLTPNDVITEHVKCFIQKHTHTGLLFYLNTIARDYDNNELKIDLAKAYSYSIDSMKGLELEFDTLISNAKRTLQQPFWYNQWKTVKVSKWKPTCTGIETFENLMLNKVVQAYQQIGFKKPTEIDPQLILEMDMKTPIEQWRIDFESAYKKWNDHWKEKKKRTFESTQVDFTFNDRFFNERLNTIMSNMISFQNKNNIVDEPNWQQLFIADTFGKHLVAKASVWMQLAYEKEKKLCQDYEQSENKQYRKSILKSPFLYTCALPYLAMLKIREFKIPSLTHPEVKVKIC